MYDEPEPGRSFAPDEIGWIDFELKSSEDIKAGTYRYMDAAEVIICAYAIGDGEVKTVAVQDFDSPLDWWDMPAEFREFHDEVVAGRAAWVRLERSVRQGRMELRHARFPADAARAHHRRHDAGDRRPACRPSLKMAGAATPASPPRSRAARI